VLKAAIKQFLGVCLNYWMLLAYEFENRKWVIHKKQPGHCVRGQVNMKGMG
jgi:hypothetical protein